MQTTTNIDPKLESFLNAAIGGMYLDERTPEAIARTTMIAARAYVNGTCLWHESNRMHNEEVAARNDRCDICGGLVDASRQESRHNLCVARQRIGVATPKMHSFSLCSCTRCYEARPAFIGDGYTEQFTDLIASLGDAVEVAQ